MTIQQLFLQQGNLAADNEIRLNIVESFSLLFGPKMYDNTISNFVNPKSNKALEAIKQQCPFKPQVASNNTNKLAQRRYERDLTERANDIDRIRQT